MYIKPHQPGTLILQNLKRNIFYHPILKEHKPLSQKFLFKNHLDILPGSKIFLIIRDGPAN